MDESALERVEDVVSSIRQHADRLCEATNADDAYDAKLDLEKAIKDLDALLLR